MLFRHALLGVVALFGPAGSLYAQSYPSKAIRCVVGFPPGGATDIVARILGQKLAEIWGQPMVIDNRSGASGTIAADLVAKSQPNGYTVLISSATSTAIATSLYSKLPYDVLKDLTIVTVIGSSPALLVINPALPPRNFAEFVAFAKTNPQTLTFGGAGQGSSGHLTGELFNLALNVKLTHVPYKGEPLALNDVMGGHLSFMFSSLPVVLPHAKTGRVRALAVTSLQRSLVAPEYPTVAESGIPGFESISWNALYVPGATPRDVVRRLHGDTVKALSAPEVNDKLAQQGVDRAGNSPEDAANFLKSEIAKWAKVIKSANVRVE